MEAEVCPVAVSRFNSSNEDRLIDKQNTNSAMVAKRKTEWFHLALVNVQDSLVPKQQHE